ncbi:GNAT family N-acetyltransferase [Pseudomonas sp. PB103]|jgi:GNAT superfamily N-acetyltransferase|uniref:GNAT family N-acetyltransferase n=1 Tax=Pseudomonas sp. PB103 TaxID=2494698 RepID=UPI00131D07F2|nr:GNAT family N-acetyltransferase [Pseudomonas sp. PB103]KAE9641458.1 GNAT family N-acetyltransferase [Pseudomonas sp. PB103]
MEAPICIRSALPADSGIISRIIERSIRVGCAFDHRNDPRRVSAWLAQLSAEQISAWLANPQCYVNVALLGDKPVGVGMAAACGEITFCYVQPEWFRRGAGRALMNDLHGWLRIRGVLHVNLNSTRTGQAFYRRLGYRESAQPAARDGLQTLAMTQSFDTSA